MPVANFLKKVVGELETPRSKRPFGSGWLSGSIALLAGVTGLLMVIVLRYPSLTSMPDLAPVHQMLFFKPVLYFVLISGYILAILSMMLRREKTLGAAAMFTVLLASLLGMLPVRHQLQIDVVKREVAMKREELEPGVGVDLAPADLHESSADGQHLQPGALCGAGQAVEHDVDTVPVGVTADLLGELGAAGVVDMLDPLVAQQCSP